MGLETLLLILDHLFCWGFTSELVLRLAAHRWKFFRSVQNLLDIPIVVAAFFELYILNIIQASADSSNSTIRWLILLAKLTKVLRVVRVLAMVAELRLLAISIIHAVEALIWSFLFLVLLMQIAAIVMTQLLQDFIMDSSNDAQLRQQCYLYFGRFSHSMITMVEITLSTGPWGKIGRLLIYDVSPWFVFFIIPYLFLGSFAVMRVVAALFLKQTLAAAAADPEIALIQKKMKCEKDTDQLHALFEEADKDSSGDLDFEEFKRMLKEPRVQVVLSTFEISPADAEEFFWMIDKSGNSNGTICLDEFVRGLMRARVSAKNLDVQNISFMAQGLQKQLTNVEKLVQDLCPSPPPPRAAGGAELL